jgi:hypothetical protein
VPGRLPLTKPGVCFFWDRASSSFSAAQLPRVRVIRVIEDRIDRAGYRFRAASGERLICSMCN